MSVADSSKLAVKDDLQCEPYRAVPLSTRNIAVIIVFLTLFSIVYLFYAQNHKILFYVMTSVIVVWIAFVYCSGILAVLYMVRHDYSSEDNSQSTSGRTIDESSI